MPGTVISINIADREGDPVRSVGEADLVAGRGIVGDRYYHKEGLRPHQELTLVEAEQIERFGAEAGLKIDPAQTRRNIVTRGIALNDLVGRKFSIGPARLEGIELCEPCRFVAGQLLAKLPEGAATEPRIVTGLTRRAGLRARIVAGGTIRVGDAVG